MKINLKALNEQAIAKTTGSKKMRLSENASSMVFQLFTKNVYSNPIGTVVREITSNCFDSHVEAKVDSPVIIRKTVDKETGSMYISFIDFGVGMSPQRVEDIYMVYFESTKRVDNTQIGGFGIGGKTPLAYKRSTGKGEQEYDNSFNVITVFDNVKYYYLVYEGEDCPETILLHSEIVDEHNGTEIKIPVLEGDVYKFEKEMVRQLYYFENVIFEGFEDEDGESRMKNDYQIVRGKNFLFRGNQYADYMHICLGRVAYPIDFNTLGLSSSDYRLPVALKLEVGDINVTVSRESVDYSEATIKMLKKKLEEAKAELIALLSKQYDNVQSLEDYFQVKSDFGRLNFPNGESINLSNLIDKGDMKFKNFRYNYFVKMPNDKQLFQFFFDNKMYGKKPSTGRRRRRRYSSYDEPTSSNVFEGSYDDLLKGNANVLFADGEFNRKLVKQAYLKFTHGNFFIVQKHNLAWASKADIADLFSHSLDSLTDANGQLLPVVKLFYQMQEEYFEIVKKHCSDYDTLIVPDSFVITRKREAITKEMRNTTISARLYNEYAGSQLRRIKLNELFNFKEPIYYGTKEDEYQMKKAIKVFGVLFNKGSIVSRYSESSQVFKPEEKKRIMFLQVSQGNLKYMDFCRNARPIKSIYHTLFYRKEDAVKSYFQSHDLIQRFNETNGLYRTKGFDKINKKWFDKATDVKKYFDSLQYRNSNMANMKYELGQYFKLDTVDLTADQKVMSRNMEDLKKFESRNSEVMQYIDLPYRMEEIPQTLINILKVIMVS